MPNGRKKRELWFHRAIKLHNFLSAPFENYTFLGEYEALFTQKTRTIEARVRQLGSRPGKAGVIAGLFFFRLRAVGPRQCADSPLAPGRPT